MDDRGFWLRIVAGFLRPILMLLTRRTWHGAENLPKHGPAIIVPNHISYADPLIVAHYIYDLGRTPRFLAKDSLFRIPIVGWLLRRCRQIPVVRNSGDAVNALTPAMEALGDGGVVIVYPEGTVTKDPTLWPMQGKSGAVRLALATGAPIVPLAQWGAHGLVDPFTKKIRLRRVSVTVTAGPPVDLSSFQGEPVTGELLADATDILMRRLRDDVAAVRGESAPTGPLFEPAR